MDCELCERIGKGAFGNVYLANDHGVPCAVKVMKIDRMITMFEPERKILHHVCLLQSKLTPARRHVVPVHRSFVDDEKKICGFVMDLYKSTLLDYIDIVYERNESPPLFVFRDIVMQIAAALDFVHNTCNVIHGDLKPENILFRNWRLQDVDGSWPPGTDELGLVDFGLGCMANCPDAKKRVQTREYRAPEIIEPNTHTNYDRSIDVWSLGCIIFEIACGDILFWVDPVTNAKSKSMGNRIRDRRHMLEISKWSSVPKTLLTHPKLVACPYRSLVVELCDMCLAIDRSSRARPRDVLSRLNSFTLDVEPSDTDSLSVTDLSDSDISRSSTCSSATNYSNSDNRSNSMPDAGYID